MMRGYILVETLVAMAVLSVSLLAINGAMRQAAVAKAVARDYTHARFVLEQVVGTVELMQFVSPGTKAGQYPGPLSHYNWEYEISTVPVPAPEVQINPNDPVQAGVIQNLINEDGEIELPVSEIPKVRVRVFWTRGGQEFSETIETLLDPARVQVAVPAGDSA